MTLFTRSDCSLCNQLKAQFDLAALHVNVEELDKGGAASLAHLAWHSLVEDARKSLPLLVLDDSSTISDFNEINAMLAARAGRVPDAMRKGSGAECATGTCSISV